MNHGVKATNLVALRNTYPDNVPPFEILPFEEVIDSYKATVRRVNTLVANAFAKSIPTTQLEAVTTGITKSVKLNQRALANYHKKILAHGWTKVSIRTSALLEDGERQSFAGQYVTFLDITYNKQKLEKYVLECFKSLFSTRVINYAKTHRLQNFPIGGSAIVQQMFYGQKSGVLFTEDGQGQMTFAVANSWRNTIVEGDNATIIKIPRTTCEAPGVPLKIQQIGKLGIDLDAHYGRPLDIEWAYDSRQVMLLQMRPQTTNTSSYSLTWDATNISENYPGITLPLTYSFIRNVYAQVYPSFFRLMGMSQKKLGHNSWIFDNALGYIDGRVYYRIDNWYELVRLIPGRRNQEFFEAMLNPAKKRAKTDPSAKLNGALFNPSLWLLGLRFGWLLLRSGRYSKVFAKKFGAKLEQYQRLDWSAMTAEASLTHLRHIRQELMVMWGVPILNDVRLMIFHGIFKTRLLKNASPKTYLHHLKGLTDQASIKPLEALHDLGQELDRAMKRGGARRLEDVRASKTWSEVETAAQAFITRFGGRTPDELQLENPRLGDNIWDILQLAYASRNAKLTVHKPTALNFDNLPPYKRLLTRLVVHNMRQAIDYRERFRFNRAQVFGLTRTAYLAVGGRLVEAKVIKHPEDIFWLTEQEIEAVIQGHSWSYDLAGVISQRKRQFIEHNKKPFCMRIAGEGPVAPAQAKKAMPDNPFAKSLIGTGVSPGKLTAPVVVVDAFNPKLDVNGKILVVRHIDPGWTLLLVQAAGVITEQGNPLSHVAIVAREINMPAVVGIADALTKFKTGVRVTMDGTTGEVTYGS